MIRWITLAGLVLWAGGPVMAEVQGMLGTTSEGEITVSVDIEKAAPLMSITNLSDVNFDKIEGDSASADQKISACVYIDQDIEYTVIVDAGPLTEGGVSYPYEIEIGQNLSNSSTMSLSVSDMPETETVTGFQPSSTPGCANSNVLELTFRDEGAADAVGPFSASATVTIMIMPG